MTELISNEIQLKPFEEIDKYLTEIYNIVLNKDEESILKILKII